MLKKIGVVVAACACVLLLSVSASADTVSKGRVTASALNVRSMPTTDSSIVGVLPNENEVIIVSQEGDWLKIYYNGQYAYVHASYVLITQTNIEYQLPQAQTITTSPSAVPNPTGVIPSYAGSQVPGEAVVELCKQYLGVPYVYGGMSPSGFDCSGLVKYCYSLMGVNLNRVACDQALNGIAVSVDAMLPGDIICFSSDIGGSYIGHVGIYVGNGYFIHAPRTGKNVEIVPLSNTYYKQRVNTVRRIFY